MLKLYRFIILVSIAASCILTYSCDEENSSKSESESRQIQTTEEPAQIKQARNDSTMMVLDSLFSLDIKVPTLYYKSNDAIFDSETTVKFSKLAKGTGGKLKLLVNSKYITREIINILQSHSADNADVMFLIDKTGSMSDDIENVKEGLDQVLRSLEKYENIRLGFSLYGDKNCDGPTWHTYRNFEHDFAAARKFVNGITVTSGGDMPESVYDGFFKTIDRKFWKSKNKRMIILIGDAPPLEKPLSDYSIDDVIRKATSDSINMNFYPIVVTPYSDGMAPVSPVKTYEKSKLISSLYPNPSFGMVNLSLERDDDYTIEIFNSSGARVMTENFSGGQWRKDLSSLANGAYMLRVITKDKRFETSKYIMNK